MEVTVVLKSGFTTKIEANNVLNITGTIERTSFRSETFKQALKQFELADTIPVKKGNCNSDLLVGNNYYGDIVLTKSVMLWDGLYLFGSKFGWILSGSAENEYTALDDAYVLFGWNFNQFPWIQWDRSFHIQHLTSRWFLGIRNNWNKGILNNNWWWKSTFSIQ